MLQVIEGDEPQVLSLFLAIEKDNRHAGVTKAGVIKACSSSAWQDMHRSFF